MSFNVTFDVSVSDFNPIINKLLANVDTFLDKVAEYGEQKARENLASYDMPFATGALESSIHTEKSEEYERFVIANGGHAAFVEYGTGVVGEYSPHPNPEREWAYDVNGHGDNGWYYQKDGQLHWTQGMPSRPFMYRTLVDIEENAMEIAREVFK